MNPSQHAEQFQSQLANYVPQFTPEFWPVWLIIAGVLLVGMWLVLGLRLASCSWREEISHRSW